MKQVATLIVVAVVLAVPLAGAKEPLKPRTVFGIAWQKRQTSVLELDALTLKPVSKAIKLGIAGSYLGRSPGGGMRAAFAVGERANAIRFVNLSTMKPEQRVALPCATSGPTLWETADRLVVTCGSSASSVLVLDPVKQRLVSRKELTGELQNLQAANGLIVGVLAPLGQIGAARLVEISGTGFTRIVALPGVLAGTTVLDQNTSHFRVEQPAVAIEPQGHRAAVVPAAGPVSIVDLSKLTVTSYAVRTLAAARKEVEGSERSAIWTWNDTIAVGGRDWTANGEPENPLPTGVTLIDTTNWTARTLDHDATGLSYTGIGGVLLAWGSVWDTASQRSIGNGLTGYGTDGTRRFHLFGSDPIAIAAVAGTYAYITGDASHYEIVDTMTGKVIGSPVTSRPTTLAATRPNY
jgi:hypothetical protein